MSVELQSHSEHKHHAHNGTAPSPISNATAAANSASAGGAAADSQLQQSQSQAPLPHPAKSAHLSLLYSGNNTLFCGGRFIVGPGPDAFLATALVILVPGAVFIGTTSVDHATTAAAQWHAGRWCAERGVACTTTVRMDRESALLRLHASELCVTVCPAPAAPVHAAPSPSST